MLIDNFIVRHIYDVQCSAQQAVYMQTHHRASQAIRKCEINELILPKSFIIIKTQFQIVSSYDYIVGLHIQWVFQEYYSYPNHAYLQCRSYIIHMFCRQRKTIINKQLEHEAICMRCTLCNTHRLNRSRLQLLEFPIVVFTVREHCAALPV